MAAAPNNFSASPGRWTQHRWLHMEPAAPLRLQSVSIFAWITSLIIRAIAPSFTYSEARLPIPAISFAARSVIPPTGCPEAGARNENHDPESLTITSVSPSPLCSGTSFFTPACFRPRQTYQSPWVVGRQFRFLPSIGNQPYVLRLGRLAKQPHQHERWRRSKATRISPVLTKFSDRA